MNTLSVDRVATTPKDYSTQPICNLRDVFFLPGIIYPDLQGFIFRSGKVKNLPDSTKFKTIVNFCCEEDDFDTSHTLPLHFPFPDKLNVYDLHDDGTRTWCHRVLEGIAHCSFPLLFHCFSGKDRTGIIAAILQKIWDVPDELISLDYSNSDGELSPDLFEQFLRDLPELFLPFVSLETIDLLMKSCSSVPQKSRVRGGYLPRHLQLSFPSSSPQGCPWQYDIDGSGRLCRVRGALYPISEDMISKRKVWQRVSAFGSCCNQFYEQSYQWVPVIPQEVGGVNSPVNEILIKKSALDQYRKEFERCLKLKVSMNIIVSFDYGNDEMNTAVGLQKPATILLKLIDTEDANDDDSDSMEIIYN